MQTAFVMEIINERLGDFMSDREIVRWLATPNAQCEGGRAPGYEIAFLRADPVLALVSQMWSGRMAHPIALDRLQGARAALKLAEASGDPEGIAYAEWALNAAHQGFGFVAALSAARVSFAGEG